jgi:hypothetical protein
VPVWLQLILVFLFALILEIGWVVSVRLVTKRTVVLLVLTAMAMQSISYLSTLLIVQNSLTIVGGIIGSGLGALVALRFPDGWFERSDPRQ